MSTNATISVALNNGRFANIYCHYDGQPARMLPILANYTDEQLLAAKEIRFMDENAIEAFKDPHSPEITFSAQVGCGYHYVRDQNGEWEVR